MEEKLKQIIAEILKIPVENFDMEEEFKYIENFDSLTLLRMIAEIEEKFSISIPFDDIQNINKPGDFLKYLGN